MEGLVGGELLDEVLLPRSLEVERVHQDQPGERVEHAGWDQLLDPVLGPLRGPVVDGDASAFGVADEVHRRSPAPYSRARVSRNGFSNVMVCSPNSWLAAPQRDLALLAVELLLGAGQRLDVRRERVQPAVQPLRLDAAQDIGHLGQGLARGHRSGSSRAPPRRSTATARGCPRSRPARRRARRPGRAAPRPRPAAPSADPVARSTSDETSLMGPGSAARGSDFGRSGSEPQALTRTPPPRASRATRRVITQV